MKKIYLIFFFLFVFLTLIFINAECQAAELDIIKNYEVIVEPRMNDGSLDITYEITWEVLDGTTEGPLSWVKIGTPNEHFDTATALSKNIKSISHYGGSYVRIDFNNAYKTGESVTFKYSIHQEYMYDISWGKCKYEFTPAWFTDIRVDTLTVKWNKDSVKSDNSNKTEGNYLVWQKKYMGKGEKLKIKVKYDKSAFSSLNYNKVRQNTYNGNSGGMGAIFPTIFCVIVIIASILLPMSGGYYGHRGFYGGGHYYRGIPLELCLCLCTF